MLGLLEVPATGLCVSRAVRDGSLGGFDFNTSVGWHDADAGEDGANSPRADGPSRDGVEPGIARVGGLESDDGVDGELFDVFADGLRAGDRLACGGVVDGGARWLVAAVKLATVGNEPV